MSVFEKISSGCGDGTTDEYGGGFIAQTDNGCMEWLLYGQEVQGECSCNEDGCTDDSPACCANGTCGTSQEPSVARVTLIAHSEVDVTFSSRLNSVSHKRDTTPAVGLWTFAVGV